MIDGLEPDGARKAAEAYRNELCTPAEQAIMAKRRLRPWRLSPRRNRIAREFPRLTSSSSTEL